MGATTVHCCQTHMLQNDSCKPRWLAWDTRTSCKQQHLKKPVPHSQFHFDWRYMLTSYDDNTTVLGHTRKSKKHTIFMRTGNLSLYLQSWETSVCNFMVSIAVGKRETWSSNSQNLFRGVPCISFIHYFTKPEQDSADISWSCASFIIDSLVEVDVTDQFQWSWSPWISKMTCNWKHINFMNICGSWWTQRNPFNLLLSEVSHVSPHMDQHWCNDVKDCRWVLQASGSQCWSCSTTALQISHLSLLYAHKNQHWEPMV